MSGLASETRIQVSSQAFQQAEGSPFLAVKVSATPDKRGIVPGGYLMYAPVIFRRSLGISSVEFLGFIPFSPGIDVLGELAVDTKVMLSLEVTRKQVKEYMERERDRVIAMFGSIDDYRRCRKDGNLPPHSMLFRTFPGLRQDYNKYLGGRW